MTIDETKAPKERPFMHRWRSALLNSALSSRTKIVLLGLAEFADSDGTKCRPATETIAELASVDEKTARRALTEGSDNGWIDRWHVKSGQAWRRWEYELRLPEAADTTPARSRKAAEPLPAPSSEAADTAPAPSASTCGNPVQKVRASCPKGAGTVPSKLEELLAGRALAGRALAGRAASLRSASSSPSSSPSADDPSVPKLELEAPKAPADLSAAKAERVRQVTTDAIEAYNAILARPRGLLPKVTKVRIEKREELVKRCLRTAREICDEVYKSPTITRRFWDVYFGECSRDDFLAGRKAGGKDHENWKPNFEYLTRDAVMLKLFDEASSREAAA